MVNQDKRRFLPQTHTARALAALLLIVIAVLAVVIKETPRQVGRRTLLRDGKQLLWARGHPESPDAEWFDVTNSKIDPNTFQFGIGKDSIRAIDHPTFLEADDPRLREWGIDDQTLVIGYAVGDDARAYPLRILDRHELVNDVVGGRPVTVGW
ncbi:MAG: DUF3179 domain-containing protein [Phycisphaerales bacterium]|nr:MAG: DUF3179 domain-containing protein [Phycisphaerales bacterium]